MPGGNPIASISYDPFYHTFYYSNTQWAGQSYDFYLYFNNVASGNSVKIPIKSDSLYDSVIEQSGIRYYRLFDDYSHVMLHNMSSDYVADTWFFMSGMAVDLTNFGFTIIGDCDTNVIMFSGVNSENISCDFVGEYHKAYVPQFMLYGEHYITVTVAGIATEATLSESTNASDKMVLATTANRPVLDNMVALDSCGNFRIDYYVRTNDTEITTEAIHYLQLQGYDGTLAQWVDLPVVFDSDNHFYNYYRGYYDENNVWQNHSVWDASDSATGVGKRSTIINLGTNPSYSSYRLKKVYSDYLPANNTLYSSDYSAPPTYVNVSETVVTTGSTWSDATYRRAALDLNRNHLYGSGDEKYTYTFYYSTDNINWIPMKERDDMTSDDQISYLLYDTTADLLRYVINFYDNTNTPYYLRVHTQVTFKSTSCSGYTFDYYISEPISWDYTKREIVWGSGYPYFDSANSVVELQADVGEIPRISDYIMRTHFKVRIDPTTTSTGYIGYDQQTDEIQSVPVGGETPLDTSILTWEDYPPYSGTWGYYVYTRVHFPEDVYHVKDYYIYSPTASVYVKYLYDPQKEETKNMLVMDGMNISDKILGFIIREGSESVNELELSLVYDSVTADIPDGTPITFIWRNIRFTGFVDNGNSTPNISCFDNGYWIFKDIARAKKFPIMEQVNEKEYRDNTSQKYRRRSLPSARTTSSVKVKVHQIDSLMKTEMVWSNGDIGDVLAKAKYLPTPINIIPYGSFIDLGVGKANNKDEKVEEKWVSVSDAIRSEVNNIHYIKKVFNNNITLKAFEDIEFDSVNGLNYKEIKELIRFGKNAAQYTIEVPYYEYPFGVGCVVSFSDELASQFNMYGDYVVTEETFSLMDGKLSLQILVEPLF